MPYKLLPIAALFLVIYSCSTHPTRPVTGSYDLIFHVKDVEIPIQLEITDSAWYIHNANEIITVNPSWPSPDSFHITMPLFQTTLAGRIINEKSLAGHWTDPTRSQPNSTPFTITQREVKTYPTTSEHITTKWDCTFSPNNNKDKSRAIGLFETKGEQLQGTFLTETGDYRYLSGESTGQSFHLTCFDGTHLFYFCANIEGDSLTHGRFISGNTWDEEWEGHLNPAAELRDPDSLTTMRQNDKLKFTATNLDGKTVYFDSSQFLNKVTIVQIFGSWCPNCTDESKFFNELFQKQKDRNLQIIPVGFEREATQEVQLARIKRQFQELGVAYPPYLGGLSPKSQAEETFPQLNHVFSYPTAIFIDKKSQVRKIHTGFYGPSTGKYYAHHTEQLSMFVDQLLNEN